MILRKINVKGVITTFYKGYDADVISEHSPHGDDGMMIMFVSESDMADNKLFVANTHLYMYTVPDDYKDEDYDGWIDRTLLDYFAGNTAEIKKNLIV